MQAVCCAIKKIPTNVLSHSFNYYIIRIHQNQWTGNAARYIFRTRIRVVILVFRRLLCYTV